MGVGPSRGDQTDEQHDGDHLDVRLVDDQEAASQAALFAQIEAEQRARAAASHDDGGAGAANNFGLGNFWGGSRAQLRIPRDSTAQQFPSLRGLTMATLTAEGLEPDLAFVPFQMPRCAVRVPEEEERRVRERPTLRCRQPFKVAKHTIALTPGNSAFTLFFTLESLIAVRVSVHSFCNEVVEDSKLLAPGGASSKPHFQPNSAVPAAAAITSSQTFLAGKHVFTLDSPIDLAGVTDLQLHHSNRHRFFPLVILMEEVDQAAPSHASPVVAPRIASLTTYCSLVKQANGLITPKVIRSVVRILPSGHVFELLEVFGRDEGPSQQDAEEEEKSTSASPTVAMPPGQSSSTLAECVVCMSDARDTAILPCRHMCVCHGCAQILKAQTPARCPVCRFAIESTVRITMPAPPVVDTRT